MSVTNKPSVPIYRFEQNTPASVWKVEHNLGRPAQAVHLYFNGLKVSFLEQVITQQDDGQVAILNGDKSAAALVSRLLRVLRAGNISLSGLVPVCVPPGPCWLVCLLR